VAPVTVPPRITSHRERQGIRARILCGLLTTWVMCCAAMHPFSRSLCVQSQYLNAIAAYLQRRSNTIRYSGRNSMQRIRVKEGVSFTTTL